MISKTIKVNPRETPELHDFRARYARLARKLPKKLQGPVFAHILATDCRTRDRWYSKDVMVAYSKALAPKYKMPVATIADIKRYNPELIKLGFIDRIYRGESDWGRDGKLRWQQKENRYVVHVEVLDALEIPSLPGDTAQSEPLTAPPTAPYIVSKETENRVNPESRLKTASSSGRDDEGSSLTGENRAKGSTRSKATARAMDEFPVDPDVLEDLTQAINNALEGFGIKLPVPFSFDRLPSGDRSRVPGLIDMLHREDHFDICDLLRGLALEGDHNIGKIFHGAQWLNIVLRGVSEADLRKWIARGKEYYATQESDMIEALERAEREAAELQAREEARQEAAQARLEAERARAAAKAQAEEDSRKLASEWVPALDGVNLASIRWAITDDPLPFYINVVTKGIRPTRGRARPGEAKVYIKRTTNGPVLAEEPQS